MECFRKHIKLLVTEIKYYAHIYYLNLMKHT